MNSVLELLDKIEAQQRERQLAEPVPRNALDFLGAMECPMCDYSLHNVKTRPARVGDKLFTHRFSSGTTGFAAPEDVHVAVCLLPGTELSFAYEVQRSRLWPWSKNTIRHKTAIFRQVNLDCPHAHHDALEFPDGEILLLTYLMEGQEATVLQLPATAVGSKLPQPLTFVPLPTTISQ